MCEMNKVDFPNENRPPVRSSDPAVAAAARHAREHMAQEAAHKTAPANAPEARPQHKPAAHKAEPGKRPANKKAAPRQAAPKRSTPKQKKSRVVPLMLLFLAAILTMVVYKFFVFLTDEANKVKLEVTTEVAYPVALGNFFTENPAFPDLVECNLDFATVNYDVPQDIYFTITMYYRNYPCTLHIVDTTPATAEAIPQTMFSVDEVPAAADCVTGITDATAVTVEWAEEPDITGGGELTFDAVLTDQCGNVSTVSVPFSVTKDTTAPVIDGTKDIEGYCDDPITYKDGVTVTDNYDDNPVLTIDNSAVDIYAAGEYTVTYTATDFSGNSSSTDITVTLEEKPSTYVEPEEVEAAAKEILAQITEPGMSDMEIALQICYWCRYNINYVEKADVTSQTRAAYDGLVNRSGTCYTIAYAAKALYDAAGIENMIVKREPYTYSPHYWNYICIDGEWYHCDSTPRHEYSSYFFMYTTEELQAIWLNGWNGYKFDESKYPESATESVQDKINYSQHTIKDD